MVYFKILGLQILCKCWVCHKTAFNILGYVKLKNFSLGLPKILLGLCILGLTWTPRSEIDSRSSFVSPRLAYQILEFANKYGARNTSKKSEQGTRHKIRDTAGGRRQKSIFSRGKSEANFIGI